MFLVTDPGNNLCRYTATNPIWGNNNEYDGNEFINDVETAILNNDLNGSFDVDGISISWTASDLYNFQMSVVGPTVD